MSALVAVLAILVWIGAVLCVGAVCGFLWDKDPTLDRGTRAFGAVVFSGLAVGCWLIGRWLWTQT